MKIKCVKNIVVLQCHVYSSALPINGAIKPQNGTSEKMDDGQSEEQTLERLQDDLNNLIQAQQTSLEILANICTADDDWQEMEESEDLVRETRIYSLLK